MAEELAKKARALLAARAVRVLFVDGLRCRALVRDGSTLCKVAYNGTWACAECQHGGCSHVAAVSSVVRVL